jgi:enamine deaminase RidA (YjgF/YER057c/UK114 family)
MKNCCATALEKDRISQFDDAFEVRYAKFSSPEGPDECHITLQALQLQGSFESQLRELDNAYARALKALGLTAGTAVLRRFFCSDPANQKAILKAHPLADNEAPALISIIGQAPLPVGKIALWAYHLSERGQAVAARRKANSIEIPWNQLTHCWMTDLSDCSANDSYGQTQNLFDGYINALKSRKMNLKDNVVRTWIYVRDVDSNYQGLVDARRKLFIDHGLTPQTHYIASTGIEGRCAEPKIKVSMDAYAIAGLQNKQVRYLHAPANLGPTDAYGVSFERATAIAFRDRQHIYVSGTASIDPAGQVLHEGNVLAQLNRVLLNIEALLQDAKTSFDAVAYAVVYLRDPDDARIVRQVMEQRFPLTPILYTWAPVCRPTWLVEIEAMAISEYHDKALPR